MSPPYVKLGNRTLDQWKVTELREELKKRKLTTAGLKQDLVKRLDEAVRSELEGSIDSAEDDATQSEEPIEKAEDHEDGDIVVVETVESKSGNAVDDCRGTSGECNVIEADLVLGTEATGQEGDQVTEQSVAENTEVNDTIEPMEQNYGTNEDGAATSVRIDDGHPQEDSKCELSGPTTQSTQISESSTPVVSLNEHDVNICDTQDKATHSMDQRENDDSKDLQPDQPLKHQVSEVDPNLGFQVTSESVSTESVSIIEKNELKIDVIDDNVKLELDVKPEMQQSPSSPVRDGESHPMDITESLDKKDAEEPHDINLQVENIDILKSIDCGDMGPPEKLSLDRSSGDDSMEEDVTESKLIDEKSDSFTENVEKSGTASSMKEDDLVDVVGHDKPVEMVQHVGLKVTNFGSETVSTLTSGKRKFLDREAVDNTDVAKKVRRLNVEGLKSSEPQSGSITPKLLSETDSIASVETPKESVVPPSSRAPTNSLRIDRFLRPFTLKAVQALLGKTGTVTSFWMDNIKTHCYVSYSSVEEAVQTRNAVYNLQWPPNGGRLLVAEFVDPEEVKSHLEAPLPSPATPSSTTPTQTTFAAQPSPKQQALSNPPHVRERLHPPREQLPLPARDRLTLPPPPPLPEKVDPPIVTLDDLFRKTKALPRIYYLPLSDELVAAKLETQGKNVTQ